MAENERMMKEMEQKWEEKLAAAEKENKVFVSYLKKQFVEDVLLKYFPCCIYNFFSCIFF